jgi:riboflavin kinase/FMN adenylyltransferase
MKIIDLNNYEEKNCETAVALGNFDGIHIGHKCLIEDMITKAKIRALKPSILLFTNHTKTILNNNSARFQIITSNEQKLKILDKLGVENVYNINFDEKIMQLSGEEFVEKIIIEKLNAKLVTVGFDYRFGYKALGNSEYLKEIGKVKGFETNIIEPVYIGEEIVSSTKIRDLIRIGNIKKVNEFLGHYYTIIGRVVEGENRGSKMGYPTANVELQYNYIVPKTGVYKTSILLGNKEYLGLTNIGYNPTFNEKKLKIENHILDFNEDIYGQTIEVKFIDFIRDDIKFNTVKELIEQIEKDINYVKSR